MAVSFYECGTRKSLLVKRFVECVQILCCCLYSMPLMGEWYTLGHSQIDCVSLHSFKEMEQPSFNY